MKKTYFVEVDCSVCANLCEEAIKKIPGVNGANLSFIMQKLVLDFDDSVLEKDLLKEIKYRCKRIERGFTIK